MASLPLAFNDSWTLFLDRDGVINLRPIHYVIHPDEFEFLPGVLDALAFFTNRFSRIIVVTNQQGVSKGILTDKELRAVHDYMLRAVEAHGGRIDHVYYCPEPAETNPSCRKPNTGMGLQAKEAFSEIDFSRSIMVGDAATDMDFGRRLGMTTVHVDTQNHPEEPIPPAEWVDFHFKGLKEFAEAVKGW